MNNKKLFGGVLLVLACLVSPAVLAAASGGLGGSHLGDTTPHLDGAALGMLWAFPFVGMLLSIALFPLVAPHFWEHNFGKVTAFWVIIVLWPFLLLLGWELTLFEVLHLLLLEYLPFIILLLALFTVAGGIHFGGSMRCSPGGNTALLAAGTAIASWTGTTGASMLLIRPVLRANRQRVHKAHVIIFFIFLVSNVGGALTPLGDPPLFLGFLKGVKFFWPTVHVLLPTLLVASSLLILFYLLDSYYYRKEPETVRRAPSEPARLSVNGWSNVALLGGIVAAVLLSGVWRPEARFVVFHVPLELQNVFRDVLLLLITWISWRYTDREHRAANAFNWGPIIEVAKLFAGIFVTIIPVIAILKAGQQGALASVVGAVTGPGGEPLNGMYFWLTGVLSSFLDNAPTYLVFFNAAGGDAVHLMGPLATTLAAISAGAVFMGANSYIGNAPNFMVKAIAESAGIRMPSFFGYLAWSGIFLLPLFALVTVIFFV